MNISDSFHNSFYALTGNNIEDEIITNTRLISLTMLVSKKKDTSNLTRCYTSTKLRGGKDIK